MLRSNLFHRCIENINAVFATFGGLGLTLVPAQMVTPYGFSLTPGGILMSQFLGVVLLGITVISWDLRNVKEGNVRDVVLSGFIVVHVGSTIVPIMAIQSGLMNSMGWIDVAAHGLLAAGFGYYRLKK